MVAPVMEKSPKVLNALIEYTGCEDPIRKVREMHSLRNFPVQSQNTRSATARFIVRQIPSENLFFARGLATPFWSIPFHLLFIFDFREPQLSESRSGTR